MTWPVEKAISLRQPWAHAVFSLGKDVENRSQRWRYPPVVAIHAAQQPATTAWLKWLRDDDPQGVQRLSAEEVRGLRRSAIIGVVEIVDRVTHSDSIWFTGPVGFVLKRPVRLPAPIDCDGRLGFWTMPDDVAARVAEQL